MRLDRAEQILNSSDNIKVLYQNTPVWIESVRTDNQTAHIKIMNTDSHIDVPVAELNEKRQD